MPLSGKNKMIAGIVLTVVLFGALFFYELRPAGASASVEFKIDPGDGFSSIVHRLKADGLIRSEIAFKFFSVATGAATKLKPGMYLLDGSMSSADIAADLVDGATKEVEVRVIEGSSLLEIDRALADAGVLRAGDLAHFKSASGTVEGKLYPDTYRFFENSRVEDVVKKFSENFEKKAAPILAKDPGHAEGNLILASLLEKEVSDAGDRRIVAGILKKRLEARIPLQIDATICYIKKENQPFSAVSCYPLSPLDFKIDSPYNTYLYKGLPPGPIGNPGEGALRATLEFKSSPYWFYLSDPRTRKTIFSRTLEEQEANRAKYLK